MHVLQLATKRHRRGAESFAHQLASWFRAHGHESSMLYLYPYDGPNPLPNAPGDATLDGRESSPLEKGFGLHPRLLARLRAEVLRREPDILQLNGARAVKYGAALRLWMPRAPWKLVYRNIDSPLFWVRGALRQFYYRRLIMPRMDAVVGVSEKTLEEARALYRLRVPHQFIPNGIDFSQRTPSLPREQVRAELGAKPGELALLFCGNLTAQKRPDRFVRLLHALREQGFPVTGWILGDGPLRERLEGQGLRLLGYRTEVADVMAAADLFVLCSDTEGIPAVIVEAAHCGLPVVAFDVGGVREALREGETGLVAPAGDEQALLAAVTALLQDPPLRARLGAAGRALAGRFDMEKVGAEYFSFYEKLLASREGVRKNG